MVNWREQEKLSETQTYGPLYDNHGDRLARQKEAYNMARTKRPPLAWDSAKDKPLKYQWHIWLKRSIYPSYEIGAYDVEGQWFTTPQGRVTGAPFLVQRIS